jgi:hypothetical protein
MESSTPGNTFMSESDDLQKEFNLERVSSMAQWHVMFDRLKKFKEQNGHCLVPNRYREDRSLGSWVSTQRRNFKQMATIGKGKLNSPHNCDRIKKLNELGFVWALSDPRYASWEIRFRELCDYRYRHGEAPSRNILL